MSTLTHGGRVFEFASAENVDPRQVVDFSANINPLGPSSRALETVRERLDWIRFYPDEFAGSLRRRLSTHLNVRPEYVLCGNGATELLYFWTRMLRPRRSVLFVPTFVEYRKALESVDSEIRIVNRLNGPPALASISADINAVVLTNPNNPTGSYLPESQLREWLESIPPTVHVLIDESFIEFTRNASMALHTDRWPNLWILRSLTKFYALPGLRVGYLVSQGVETLMSGREPWQVNALAEAAAIASLDDVEHAERTWQLVQRERIWLWRILQRISGVRAVSTEANYFFAACRSDSALDSLISGMRREHMLIRDCRGWEGVEGPAFRFAIRTRDDNERLLAHLRRIS